MRVEVWKALYVSSRAEIKVRERLELKGIESFVPCRKVLKQWSDRKKMVTEPLLPSYVFVRVAEINRVSVLETKGVVAFVRNLGSDAIILDSEIETLKTIEKLGYDVTLNENSFRVGEVIEIKEGPFKGRQAKVLEIAKDGTLYAFLLEGIGQCLHVKVPKVIVESVL